MNVISLKSNKKLLKGVTYEAESFDNTPATPGKRWHRNSIYIKGFCKKMILLFVSQIITNTLLKEESIESLRLEMPTLGELK